MGIGRFVIKMLGQRVERGEPMHGRGVVTTAVVVRIEAVHLYKFQFTIFVRLFVGTIAFRRREVRRDNIAYVDAL